MEWADLALLGSLDSTEILVVKSRVNEIITDMIFEDSQSLFKWLGPACLIIVNTPGKFIWPQAGGVLITIPEIDPLNCLGPIVAVLAIHATAYFGIKCGRFDIKATDVASAGKLYSGSLM